ncbi:MAG: hypothetical protein CMR00_09840 [[Chlorobium] sp. 445]|nr:MAG: hypothetical protein CMR00_09840 [[Chlorobium] sp. 445]
MKKLALIALLLAAFAAPAFAQDGKNASKSKSSCSSTEHCCPAIQESKVTDTPRKSDTKTAKKKTAPTRVASSSAA